MDSKKDVFANSQDKWDFIIALIVIAIFTVFIYQFLYNTSDEEATVNAPPPTQLDESQMAPMAFATKKEEAPQLFNAKSGEYQVKTIKVEDAYDSEIDNNNAVVITDVIKSTPLIVNTISTKPTTTDNKIIETPNSQLKVKETITTNEEPSIQIEEEIEKIKEIEAPKKIELTQPETETIVEENTTNTTAFNCVVIVGVFNEISNKEAIVDKLITLGYKHSEGILREGMNYVGVPVNCSDRKGKQELLNELNQTFGINSWIKKM